MSESHHSFTTNRLEGKTVRDVGGVSPVLERKLITLGFETAYSLVGLAMPMLDRNWKFLYIWGWCEMHIV